VVGVLAFFALRPSKGWLRKRTQRPLEASSSSFTKQWDEQLGDEGADTFIAGGKGVDTFLTGGRGLDTFITAARTSASRLPMPAAAQPADGPANLPSSYLTTGWACAAGQALLGAGHKSGSINRCCCCMGSCFPAPHASLTLCPSALHHAGPPSSSTAMPTCRESTRCCTMHKPPHCSLPGSLAGKLVAGQAAAAQTAACSSPPSYSAGCLTGASYRSGTCWAEDHTAECVACLPAVQRRCACCLGLWRCRLHIKLSCTCCYLLLPDPPTTLCRHRPLPLLQVFLATWRATPVAAKVLLDDEALTNSTAELDRLAMTRELLAEAQVMSAMRHPNLVTFMGVCLLPPCILTEHCSQGSLYGVLSKAARDPAFAAQLTWRRRLAMVRNTWHQILAACCMPGVFAIAFIHQYFNAL